MSIDRLERRLPEVLTELSLPTTPDYVDKLLSRTARTPQRPGWSFPERWIPVSTITSALPARRPISLRPLIVFAVLLALIVASIAAYVGSRPRPAPLTGLARNGAVVTTSAGVGIVAIDPETGSSRTVVAGTNLCCADVTPDGLRISFFHLRPGNEDPIGLSIANMDGSIVREIPIDTLTGITRSEWSPAGDRIVVTDRTGAHVINTSTGTLTKLDLPFSPTQASWIGTTGDLLLSLRVSQEVMRVYRLPAGATSGAAEVAKLDDAVNAPLVSPDGSKFLYFIWGPETRLEGRIHVFDFATRTDVAITPEDEQAPADITEWENVNWSPDGSHVASELYTASDVNRVAVLPADGVGEPVLVGPSFPTGTGGVIIRFSPDGQSILATYRFNDETWLLPVSGAEGRQVSWTDDEDISWQRLAP